MPKKLKKKKLYHLLIGLIAVVAIAYSCRKDREPDTGTLDSVKDWYAAYTQNRPQTLAIFRQNGQTRVSAGDSLYAAGLPIVPDWGQARSYRSGDSSITEVPVTTTGSFGAIVNKTTGAAVSPHEKPVSQLRLLFITTQRTSSAYYLNIIADKGYLEAPGNSLGDNTFKQHDTDFSGLYLYYDLNGSFIIGQKYTAGKLYGYVRHAPPGTKGSATKLVNPDYSECEYWYYCEWERLCHELGGVEWCDDPVITYEEIFTICPYTEDPPGDGCSAQKGPITVKDCGGGDPPDPPIDTLINAFCSGSTTAQMDTLKAMIGRLKKLDCASKYIYSKLVGEGKSFTFCILNDFNGNAHYKPATKTFTFSSDMVATREDIFEHEFLHAFQDDAYPGGTTQYAVLNAGYTDIEFERAVMSDIIHGTNEAFGTTGTPEQRAAYLSWISNLTDDKHTYPKLTQNPNDPAWISFIDNYNTYLTAFAQSSPYYSGSPILLRPLGLINLFNSANRDCSL